MASPGGPIRLYCATANPGKLREFQLAAGEGVEVRGLPAVPCPEPGATFEENAVAKALCYARARRAAGEERNTLPALLFADDSGLVVDALGGEPGVRSARFAGHQTDDTANNALLLDRLAGLPSGQRTARFICCIALLQGQQVLRSFRGEVEGRILERPRGSGGFGYDPLFFYSPRGKTFAEMTPEDKWRDSHRGRSFRQMLDWLRTG